MNDDSRRLIVHVVYRLDVGGLENGLVNLVNRMPDDRYRHAIVCLTGHTGFANRIARHDVDIFDLGKRPGKDLRFYGRLYKLIKHIRPEIVHTRNLGTIDCQFVAAAAGVRRRIHGEHGWYAADPDGKAIRGKLFRRLALPIINEYVAVSDHMRSWLIQQVGIPRARVVHISNGVDTRRFHPPSDCCGETQNASGRKLTIGTVGRLDPVKDHMTLLRAFRQLTDSEDDAGATLQLEIIGDGPMRDQLQNFIADNGLGDRVLLHGAVDDVPSKLAGFDLFVLASLNEGISNTVLEAMATGLPVIATEVGGNRELVVENETGAFFAPGDDRRLASLMRQYASDTVLRSSEGAAGRRRVVDHFDLDAMVEKYQRLYEHGTETCELTNQGVV